jgi:hypothetical protein
MRINKLIYNNKKATVQTVAFLMEYLLENI